MLKIKTCQKLKARLVGLDFGFGPLSEENAAAWARWKASSGAPGGWRVTRGLCPVEELKGESGRTVYFRSYAAAIKRTTVLNALEEEHSED